MILQISNNEKNTSSPFKKLINTGYDTGLCNITFLYCSIFSQTIFKLTKNTLKLITCL